MQKWYCIYIYVDINIYERALVEGIEVEVGRERYKGVRFRSRIKKRN